MLYDAQGREIKDKPREGRAVRFEASDRDFADVSRGLTPEAVDRILSAANTGDIQAQSRLALEIEEKNLTLAAHLQTRRLAVAGTEFEILPGDDSATAKTIAADFEAVLRAVPFEQTDEDIQTFDQAIVYDLMSALLPGFAVEEIIWGAGGKTIDGFLHIPQKHFTFLNSRTPCLVTTDHPNGIELPPNKFIFHRCLARSGDATRGGLIRPLAWAFVIKQLAGIKDLLRFIERYGMPFLTAKVNETAWKTDRTKIQALIRNFGSDGGACFTDAVTTELLQAANNTGDVFFRLIEYMDAAETKIVLGQTASSGDAGGLSKGQTQDNVRVDIKAADCKAIDATVTARLARPWTMFNYGPAAPVPRIKHLWEPAEDTKLASDILVNLSTAGWEPADDKEVSERFGWKLKRKPGGAVLAPPGTPGEGLRPVPEKADSAALAAEPNPPFKNGSAGPLAKGLGETPSGVSPASIAESALTEFLAGRGLEEWFGPLQIAIASAIRGEPDEAQFKARLQVLLQQLPELLSSLDSTAFEEVLSRAIYTATAAGIAGKAAALNNKE